VEAIADLRDWGKEFPELCGKDYVPVKGGLLRRLQQGW